MNTTPRTARYLCVLLLLASAPVAWSVSAQEGISRCRSALETVRSQVTGDEDRTETWEKILALKPLEEQLEKGADADPSVLRKSIDGLAAAEKPIDEVRLTKLRDALAKWIEGTPPSEPAKPADNEDGADAQAGADGGLQLGSPDGDDKADDKKDDDEELEAARKKLGDEKESAMSEEGAEAVAEAASDLNDWLKRTDARVWTQILPLRAIRDAADDPEEADPAEVAKLLATLNAEMSHLDRNGFTELRRCLQELQDEIAYPIEEDCARIARQAISQFRPIDGSRASNARNRLQQSLTELNNFLATGAKEKQDGWNKFLKLDDLNEALRSSGAPVVGTLVKSFNPFNSGEPGLELSTFSNVRDNLETYLEILQYTETTPERLAEGQRELKSAVEALDRFLQSSTDEKEKAWKEFLEWETLTEQLVESVPDTRELKTVVDQFNSEEEGLELPVYRNVARAIAKVQELSRLQKGRDAEDIYRSRIEKIAQTLERHELDPSNQTAAELVKELRWMESTGYVPEIASCIRGGFSKPNFFASVSGDFVTKQLNDTITDAQPINRQFEGSQLCGCARTQADVTARLQPNLNGVTIDVLLSGQTVTRATAQQRKVYVRTQGNTNIVASKRLFASLDGLYAEPAVAQTSTFQQTCGVCIDRRCNLGNRLIGRIARRKAEQSRCKAQSMQSREAKDTITQRMDDQARDMIQQANTRMQELRANLQKALQGRDQLRPENLSIRSTTDKIFADGKLTAGRYLGAPSDPPKVGTDSDLTMQIHQSAINNALTSILGGIKLDNARMVSMLEENGLPVPEELKVQPKAEEPTPADKDEDEDEDEEEDDDSWSITFDTLQPASIEFSEGKIRVAIRGRKFTLGAQEVNEPLEIGATYRLRKDDEGHLEARMIGDVDIVFVKSPGRLNTRQLAYKTFIKRKTAPLFQRTFSTDDLPEGNLKEQVRSLKIDEIEATRGWLAIAMSLEGLADAFQFTMSQ